MCKDIPDTFKSINTFQKSLEYHGGKATGFLSCCSASTSFELNIRVNIYSILKKPDENS